VAVVHTGERRSAAVIITATRQAASDASREVWLRVGWSTKTVAARFG